MALMAVAGICSPQARSAGQLRCPLSIFPRPCCLRSAPKPRSRRPSPLEVKSIFGWMGAAFSDFTCTCTCAACKSQAHPEQQMLHPVHDFRQRHLQWKVKTEFNKAKVHLQLSAWEPGLMSRCADLRTSATLHA